MLQPIIFTYPLTLKLHGTNDEIQLNISGIRAVLELEKDGSFTVSAISPSGFAGCGETEEAAKRDFFRNLHHIVIDLIEEGSKREIERFLAEDNGDLEALWTQAVSEAKEANRNDE